MLYGQKSVGRGPEVYTAPQAERAQAGQAQVVSKDRLTPYPHRHACYKGLNLGGFFNSIDTHVIMRGGSWLASPLVAERQTQLNRPQERARSCLHGSAPSISPQR